MSNAAGCLWHVLRGSANCQGNRHGPTPPAQCGSGGVWAEPEARRRVAVWECRPHSDPLSMASACSSLEALTRVFAALALHVAADRTRRPAGPCDAGRPAWLLRPVVGEPGCGDEDEDRPQADGRVDADASGVGRAQRRLSCGLKAGFKFRALPTCTELTCPATDLQLRFRSLSSLVDAFQRDVPPKCPRMRRA